LLQAVALLLA
jgi:hypothetical protein